MIEDLIYLWRLFSRVVEKRESDLTRCIITEQRSDLALITFKAALKHEQI